MVFAVTAVTVADALLKPAGVTPDTLRALPTEGMVEDDGTVMTAVVPFPTTEIGVTDVLKGAEEAVRLVVVPPVTAPLVEV